MLHFCMTALLGLILSTTALAADDWALDENHEHFRVTDDGSYYCLIEFDVASRALTMTRLPADPTESQMRVLAYPHLGGYISGNHCYFSFVAICELPAGIQIDYFAVQTPGRCP